MSDGDEAAGIGRVSGTRNVTVQGIMQEAVATRQCPFCDEQKIWEHNQPVPLSAHLHHWVVFYNLSPLDGTAHHIMVVPRKHVSRWGELGPGAIDEYFDSVMPPLARRFGGSYVTLSRVGDRRYNSATIDHLHVHFMAQNNTVVTRDNLSQVAPVLHAALREFRVTLDDVAGWLDMFSSYPAWDRLALDLDIRRSQKEGKAYPLRPLVFGQQQEARQRSELLCWYVDQKRYLADRTAHYTMWRKQNTALVESIRYELLMRFGQWSQMYPSYGLLYHHDIHEPYWEMVASSAKLPEFSEHATKEPPALLDLLLHAAEQRGVPWSEFVDVVRQSIDVLWAIKFKRAFPTRVKLANKVR